MGLHVLALYDLPKRALTENVKDEILVTILCTEPVVDIENVVIVLVVVALVMYGFARLCEDATGVVSRLVAELGIANVVRIEEICR